MREPIARSFPMDSRGSLKVPQGRHLGQGSHEAREPRREMRDPRLSSPLSNLQDKPV